MDFLDLTQVNNLWQFLAFVVSVAIVTAASWGMMKIKRTADKDAEKAAPALEAAQEAAGLVPAMNVLSRQVAELQDEVAHMTPIVRVRYPLALDHISTLHTAEPELSSRYPIPRALREDMDG